ncbi:hypothetical protein PSTG_00099 [Puccinia striiformis f. sp. tritici PST-78]|uniref:Uncharacterized protein n=1 Tax=Puccinia striiformis f. sp. tritici PST-78 TaxID=1165861 RepID=A0A0L0W5H9_9BASI|nr:hypothetical protein PSTG_00099 [Puccinia striiformis f. sp. tritici PST-78]
MESNKAGPPTLSSINFTAASSVIRSIPSVSVCARCPPCFFDQALDQYRVLGPHKARGFTNNFATFQVEQPGYYGMQGLKHIIQALNVMFKPRPAMVAR